MNRRSPSAPSDVFAQLRLPLMVLVVCAHSYSAVAPDYSLLASGWDTYQCLKILVGQTLVKVAVPVFFVMSGYLFFANVQAWNLQTYKAKMRRRLRTLLLPYLLWNLLAAIKLRAWTWQAFWTYWTSVGLQTDWLGHAHLMTAPANMPLWFLRDLMVVSLLTPIIYIGVQHAGRWLLAVLTVAYLSGLCPFVPGLSAYAVYFFTLGAFFAICRQDLLAVAMRVERPAYVLAVVLAVLMLLTYHTPVFSSLMLGFRLVGTAVVFCLASRLLARTSRRLPGVAVRSSYFVYLSHYVFALSFLDSAFFHLTGTSTLALCIHYLLAPLLKVLLLVALYAAYDRLRA